MNKKDKIYRQIKKSKFFNAKWYVENYQDVAISKINPAVHYMHEGWKKGYNPGPNFNTFEYVEQNPELKITNENPLVHYQRNEKIRKKAAKKLRKMKLTKVSALKKLINSLWRKVGRIAFAKEIEKNQNARIFVHLHLFYPMLWSDIKEYLKNLQSYNYDLYITHPLDFDFKVIEDIKDFKPEAKIVAIENKGYDVGPFMEVLSNLNLDDYDIIYKLHSKRTNYGKVFMYSNLFKKADWYQYLFKGVLGSFNVHKTIDILMSDDKVGMVAAKNLITLDPSHKQNFVRSYVKELKLDFVEDYKFIAGTCLASKSQALKKLKNLGLKLDSFDMTQRGFFSLAHAMERILSIDVMAQGYEIYGMPVCLFKKWLRKRKEQKLISRSSTMLLKDKRFYIDDEFFYRGLESRQIKKYELLDLPLSKLRRHWTDGKYYKLNEVSPYKYLQGDKEEYLNYAKVHKNHPKLPNMTAERFDNLVKDIEEKGYDEKSVIIVNKKNSILDGQHRACYLYHKYGGDYKAKVLKVYFGKI